MAITHIVLFEFKEGTSEADINEACKRMLALHQNCLHATTQKPYIKSLTGGTNNSPEGHAGGSTHGFVVEFENAEDRDYYVEKDPAHQEFVKFVGPKIGGLRVFDYEQGKF